MFKDTKTAEDRLECYCPDYESPKADWIVVLIAITLGLVAAWVIVDRIIGADRTIEVVSAWF